MIQESDTTKSVSWELTVLHGGTTYLEGCSGVLKVEDLDVTLGGTHDHQRVSDVHRVTTLRKLHSGHRVWRAQIPVLQEVDSGG